MFDPSARKKWLNRGSDDYRREDERERLRLFEGKPWQQVEFVIKRLWSCGTLKFRAGERHIH